MPRTNSHVVINKLGYLHEQVQVVINNQGFQHDQASQSGSHQQPWLQVVINNPGYLHTRTITVRLSFTIRVINMTWTNSQVVINNLGQAS